MKALFAAAAVIAAGGPTILGYVGSVPVGRTAPPPVDAGAAASQPSQYLVSNMVLGVDCRMRRAASAESGIVRLQAAGACEAVWPGLGGVVALARTGRGTLAMEDRSGKPVLTLSVGDGVAYEAIEPKSAMIAVSVVN